MKKVFLILVLLLIVFFRLYNLGATARFTRDESSDFMRMHQYWVDKKITLVGPISSDNEKVFSSLSYYMLMPFAVLGSFSPISVVYGTAFYGILAAVIFLLAANKLGREFLPIAAILLLFWGPLLQASRWAWNPHYVLFWNAAATFLYLLGKKRPGFLFFSGLFFGLSFHNHYIAIFASSTFILSASVLFFKKKQFREFLFLFSGYLLAFLPFVLFDLRHPPGLFFGKYFHGSPPGVEGPSLFNFLPRLARNIQVAASYISHQRLAFLVAPLIFVLLVYDLRFSRKKIFWFLPVALQLLGGVILAEYAERYFLPAVPFFFFWLILPRKGWGKAVSFSLLLLLIFGSLLSLRSRLLSNPSPPSINSFQKTVALLAEEIKSGKPKAANLLVAVSPDRDVLGEKYRDVLLIRGIKLLSPAQYQETKNLFVISASSYEKVRGERSAVMALFEEAGLKKAIAADEEWNIYWLEKK